MINDEIFFALAINEIEDLGPIRSKKLYSYFGSFKEIFNSDLEKIASVEGIGLQLSKKIKFFDNWKKIERVIKDCEKGDIQILSFNSNKYPKFLKEIPDPPPVLFCRGELMDEDNYGVAIVGSRRLTDYGRKVTDKLGSELASLGITIVSGLARGIDSIAHEASLSSNGRTVAVLGSGVSYIYPPENRRLAERITKNGAILSEYYPDAGPRRENFPQRNRIISGMTLGTLVTEATINSGALITASFALEQGKEVFAVPGNINSKNSEGTNLLIKRGAKVVTSVEDILEEIIVFIPSLKESMVNRKAAKEVQFAEDEKLVFNLLEEAMTLDELVVKSGFNVSKLHEILLNFEIKGLITKREGRYMRRN